MDPTSNFSVDDIFEGTVPTSKRAKGDASPGEYIVIKSPTGSLNRIIRGNMTEEQWTRAVENAKKRPDFHSVVEKMKSDGAKEEPVPGWQDDSGQRGKKFDPTVDDMSDSPEYPGQSDVEAIRKWDEKHPEAAAKRQSSEDSATAKAAAMRSAPGAHVMIDGVRYTVAGPNDSASKKAPIGDTVTPADGREAFGGGAPQEKVYGGGDAGEKVYGGGDAGEKVYGGGMQDTIAPSDGRAAFGGGAPDEVPLGGGPGAPQPVSPVAPDPGQPGVLDKLASALQVNPSTQAMFTGDPNAKPALAGNPGAAPQPGFSGPVNPAAQPLPGLGQNAPPSGPGMLARPGGAGAADSMKVKGGVGGLRAPGAPNGQDQIQMGLKEEHAAQLVQAHLEQEAAKQVLLNRQDLMTKLADQNAHEQRIIEGQAQIMQKHEDAMAALQTEIISAAREKIDPNRYMASKTDGQKAAGLIAAACFGFTGHGLDYLAQVDSAIDRDIRAQQANITNRREGLQAAVTGQKTMLEIAKEKGLTGLAAINAARSGLYTQYALQAEQIATATAASDPGASARAMAIHGQYLQKAGEAAAKAKQNDDKNAQEWAKIENQRYEIGLKASVAGAKAGAGKPLPAHIATKLDDYVQSAEKITRMSKLVENAGPLDRAQQKFAQNFPVGYSEDKAKASALEAEREGWMVATTKSAIQKHERDALEGLLGKRGDITSDPSAKMSQAQKMSLDQLAMAIRSYRAAGYDTTPYEEQYAAIAQGTAPVAGEKAR